MKLKLSLYILLLLIVCNCSDNDDAKPVVYPTASEFNIQQLSAEVNRASFSYNIIESIENPRLIWNTEATLDLEHHIGVLEITQEELTLEITNLEPGLSYYVRGAGDFNDEVIYTEIVEVTVTPGFNIEITGFDTHNIDLSYTVNPNIENVQLLWHSEETLDIDNNLGTLAIAQNEGEIQLPNLEAGITYYFRFSGMFNGEVVYSDLSSQTLLEQFTVTDYYPIFQDLYQVIGSNYPFEIREIDAGYLVITSGSPYIYIIKTDMNFNIEWSVELSAIGVADYFGLGHIKLNDNNEFLLAIGLSDGYPEPKSRLVKFNLNGEILSNEMFYNSTFYPITNKTTNRKIIKRQGGTATELTFDQNGEVASEEVVSENFILANILYTGDNSFIHYRSQFINPEIDYYIKTYDNHELNLDLSFGQPGIYDSIHKSSVIYNNGNIVIQPYDGFKQEEEVLPRRLFAIDAVNGNTVWDFVESEEGFSYDGKEVTLDVDGNYLSLYHDKYNEQDNNGISGLTTFDYDYATLIKSDSQGNVLWTFRDGTPNNDDNFQPLNIIPQGNNTYIIIGRKGNQPWLKRITMN